jgi:pteridine reductase
MPCDFHNKIALVTGATGRLNREVVLRLAHLGTNLAIHYHTRGEEALELADRIEKKNVRCAVYRADLTTYKGVKKLIEAVLEDFGGVDFLINGVSKFVRKRLSETDETLWKELLNLHLSAPYMLAKLLEENFRRRQGAIINFTDIWGDRPTKSFFAYSVSKGALATLTRALADELAPTTTVNAVAPGIIHFPNDYSADQREKVISRIPLGRPGTAEEVTDLVIAILSNRYITGQIFTIDGGRSLR